VFDLDSQLAGATRGQAAEEQARKALEDQEVLYRAACFLSSGNGIPAQNRADFLWIAAVFGYEGAALYEALGQLRERNRTCTHCGDPGGSGRPLITTPYGWRPYQPRMHPDCYEWAREELGPCHPFADAPWDTERIMESIMALAQQGETVSCNILRQIVPDEASPLVGQAFRRLAGQLRQTGWEKSAVPGHRGRRLRTWRLRQGS
jgi:hypothetical protein